MRYIHKNIVPSYMTEWIDARKDAGQKIVYDDFDKKKELNKDLRHEQHGLCCYCQRVIDHYQSEHGDKGSGAHNEHLYPQHIEGDMQSEQLQMDYNNIFACCIESRGCSKRQKDKQHCGESKGNKIIPNLICKENCSSYFFYSLSGEIIPAQRRELQWEKYKVLPKTVFTDDENEAFECIQVLNLNCNFLKEERKQCIDALHIMYGTKKKGELIHIREDLLAREQYPPYIELRLQYIQTLIEKQDVV